jgi:hypothetical protein
MENKKFKIIRYIVIILACIGLIGIGIYQKKNSTISVDEDPIITKTREYVNNNSTYFNELFKEKDMEYRIDTKSIIKSDEYKGYVRIINNEYSYVNEENLLIDKIIDNNSLTKVEFNENMPYDLNYIYKGEDPKNYIKYNNNLYRIIGITNTNDLKIISLDNYNNISWGLSNNINYFEGEELPKEDSVKGIFYVGYIRSETKELESIIKNEKRNNNYTIGMPKYYGYYSFANISDIISASETCTYNNILDINKENCNSYLISMLDNTYTANTLEDNKVYYVDENKKIISKELEDSIQAKKVIYVHGISKYISGDGTKDSPYEFEN